MYYKIWSKTEREHFWTYEDFRQAINGRVVDYLNDGCLVKYIIYQVEESIDESVFKEFNFGYEIVDKIG